MHNEVKKEKVISQFIYFFLFLQKITQIVAYLESFYLLYISKVSSFFFEKEQNYEYDPLGRIKSAGGSYKGGEKRYNETYSFDNDNRILEKRFNRDNGEETVYSFKYQSGTHAISSIDIIGSANGEKSVEFNYDDFGNMTKKTLTKDIVTSITEFKYDETNKLTEIMLPDDNKKLEFKYDNGGQRITKEFKDGCGTLSKNVYVNGFYELVNDAVNKHISDGQYIFATKLDNQDENTIYYTSNNIGSTVLLTNKEGNDIGKFLYSPYGELWVEEPGTTDISAIARFFCNQQYDKESGLYYMNARYYDAHLGSFITPDPAMDGLNHYDYCRSNPIMYSDPSGLSAVSDWNDWVDKWCGGGGGIDGAGTLSEERKEKYLDMLVLSEHVYNPDTLLYKKYSIISEDNLKDKGVKLVDEKSGFASALYYNNETGKYVYALRGTDETPKDWNEANIPQSFGLTTEQYELALINTKIIAEIVGKENLELTGHSLGGGLASFAGTVLGIEATTFNAAGVHKDTLAEYNKTSNDAKDFVTAFFLKGEILSYYQDRTDLPDAIGNRVELSCDRFQIPLLISPYFFNKEALYRHSAFDKMYDGIGRLFR